MSVQVLWDEDRIVYTFFNLLGCLPFNGSMICCNVFVFLFICFHLNQCGVDSIDIDRTSLTVRQRRAILSQSPWDWEFCGSNSLILTGSKLHCRSFEDVGDLCTHRKCLYRSYEMCTRAIASDTICLMKKRQSRSKPKLINNKIKHWHAYIKISLRLKTENCLQENSSNHIQSGNILLMIGCLQRFGEVFWLKSKQVETFLKILVDRTYLDKTPVGFTQILLSVSFVAKLLHSHVVNKNRVSAHLTLVYSMDKMLCLSLILEYLYFINIHPSDCPKISLNITSLHPTIRRTQLFCGIHSTLRYYPNSHWVSLKITTKVFTTGNILYNCDMFQCNSLSSKTIRTSNSNIRPWYGVFFHTTNQTFLVYLIQVTKTQRIVVTLVGDSEILLYNGPGEKSQLQEPRSQCKSHSESTCEKVFLTSYFVCVAHVFSHSGKVFLRYTTHISHNNISILLTKDIPHKYLFQSTKGSRVSIVHITAAHSFNVNVTVANVQNPDALNILCTYGGIRVYQPQLESISPIRTVCHPIENRYIYSNSSEALLILYSFGEYCSVSFSIQVSFTTCAALPVNLFNFLLTRMFLYKNKPVLTIESELGKCVVVQLNTQNAKLIFFGHQETFQVGLFLRPKHIATEGKKLYISVYGSKGELTCSG